MRTIIFGTYDTAMHPRIATIAEGLAARGFDVTECNIPLGLTTADRVDMLAKPWKAAALVTRLAGRWAGLAARARKPGAAGRGRRRLPGPLRRPPGPAAVPPGHGSRSCSTT